MSGGANPRSIHNPILPGFNPDPSILRVGDDYFIATSTFEWFPGVRIHHSRDLVHWHLASRALTRVEQLDLRGDPNSGGIFAPDLSFRDGRYHLVYSDVKARGNTFTDVHNFLVMASAVDGPWSDRVALNSSGFDPSLFHDDDGRSWLINPVRDYRQGRPMHQGIVLQEYSRETTSLVGPRTMIYTGSGRPWVEGPHLYRHDGCYYLVTAEGGTGYDHAVIVSRSRSLVGPYESDPGGPVLSSADDPGAALQRAGHASLVETVGGAWYIAHLSSRPVRGLRFSPLGRETSLQRVLWTDDGWLRLRGGGHGPRQQVDGPDLPEAPWPGRPERDDFDSLELDPEFDALRVPIEESWLSLRERPGWLRLRGRESLSSLHEQSLVARRVTGFTWSASTYVEFAPETFQQMAGLICYYDTRNYLYVRISFDETAGIGLGLVQMERGIHRIAYEEPLPDTARGAHLRVSADADAIRFARSWDGADWQDVGPTFDPLLLSDEYVSPTLAFTGTYVGLCAQDLSGAGIAADFDFFAYRVDVDVSSIGGDP